MFKRLKKKIPCYVLIYKEVDIIKQSLDSLSQLSNDLEIIVIENPSENSKKIKKYIDKLGKDSKISRHYLFDKNITNNAFDVVLHDELSHIIKHKLIVITDGDLTVEYPQDWLKESLKLMKYKDVFCAGSGLMLDNLPTKTFPDAATWVPELINDTPFHEGRTGCHMLMMKGKDLASFLKWKDYNNKSFADGEINRFCYEVSKKKWARTNENLAYHLTWDLYQDLNNEYTKLKTNKSFEATWYHKNTSEYNLTTY